jgi:hypothetical protein
MNAALTVTLTIQRKTPEFICCLPELGPMTWRRILKEAQLKEAQLYDQHAATKLWRRRQGPLNPRWPAPRFHTIRGEGLLNRTAFFENGALTCKAGVYLWLRMGLWVYYVGSATECFKERWVTSKIQRMPHPQDVMMFFECDGVIMSLDFEQDLIELFGTAARGLPPSNHRNAVSRVRLFYPDSSSHGIS